MAPLLWFAGPALACAAEAHNPSGSLAGVVITSGPTGRYFHSKNSKLGTSDPVVLSPAIVDFLLGTEGTGEDQ